MNCNVSFITGSLFYPFLLSLLCLSLLSTSCVGKKKFLKEVARRTTCDSTLQQLNNHNMTLNRQIATLKLQLAEKTGEAKAYSNLLEKQDEQINRLDKEIRKLTSQSQDQQASMDERLKKQMQKVAEKEAVLESYRSAVLQQDLKLKELLEKISAALPEYGPEDIALEERNNKGYIVLSENILFRSGTTRLKDNAYAILEQIANVLLQYPEMDVYVIGHTDNKPVGRGSRLEDNWDLSVLRATPVVRTLTKDFGLNPNQVVAGGKGEFKPRTSNESPEGREENRRTEIVIHTPSERILRTIRSDGN